MDKHISDDDKKKIIDELISRGGNKPCSRCGESNFTILDGYFAHTIQTELKNVKLGGTTVPVAVIVCKNCGAISEHSLGILGLLDKKADGEEKS